MKTRRFYFLISLITLLGMGQGHLNASNNEETITLKFVETSDVHGCYFPYDFIQNKQMRGSLAHDKGSLSKVLTILSFYDINLTKIQSLPNIGHEWEYLFYVDLTFDNLTRYRQSIDAITPLVKKIKVLGEYEEKE